MKKILVIEDEDNIRSFVVINLKRAGYDVLEAASGEEAFEVLERNRDVVLMVVDLMLPGIDGYEICRRIRARGSDMGIIMLTARSQEMDKVTGLMTGADDYITKPFSIDELGVRVMAHLRREKRGRQSKKESEETKGFRIRYDERSVRFDGEEIRLTKTEFDILEFLSMHPRQVFSKEQIYEAVRGLEGNGDNSIVTEHIRRLRGKIAQKTKEDYIETVWGVGYKWIG